MKDDRDRPLSTRDIANAARAERPEPPLDVKLRRDREAPQPGDRDSQRHPAGQPAAAPAAVADDGHTVLFPNEETEGYRSRWEAIQTGFVDEPRKAVEEAHALVAQVVTRVAEVFSHERTEIEKQWDRGDNISTEDLRIALKRYRSFFDRLLSV